MIGYDILGLLQTVLNIKNNYDTVSLKPNRYSKL